MNVAWLILGLINVMFALVNFGFAFYGALRGWDAVTVIVNALVAVLCLFIGVTAILRAGRL